MDLDQLKPVSKRSSVFKPAATKARANATARTQQLAPQKQAEAPQEQQPASAVGGLTDGEHPHAAASTARVMPVVPAASLPPRKRPAASLEVEGLAAAPKVRRFMPAGTRRGGAGSGSAGAPTSPQQPPTAVQQAPTTVKPAAQLIAPPAAQRQPAPHGDPFGAPPAGVRTAPPHAPPAQQPPVPLRPAPQQPQRSPASASKQPPAARQSRRQPAVSRAAAKKFQARAPPSMVAPPTAPAAQASPVLAPSAAALAAAAAAMTAPAAARQPPRRARASTLAPAAPAAPAAAAGANVAALAREVELPADKMSELIAAAARMRAPGAGTGAAAAGPSSSGAASQDTHSTVTDSEPPSPTAQPGPKGNGLTPRRAKKALGPKAKPRFSLRGFRHATAAGLAAGAPAPPRDPKAKLPRGAVLVVTSQLDSQTGAIVPVVVPPQLQRPKGMPPVAVAQKVRQGKGAVGAHAVKMPWRGHGMPAGMLCCSLAWHLAATHALPPGPPSLLISLLCPPHLKRSCPLRKTTQCVHRRGTGST